MADVPRLGSGIPLIARDRELDVLRQALHTAESGTANAVLLSGDAGVGKSRLLAELAVEAAAQDALVLTGRCVDGGAGLPYLPFVDALGQLTGEDREILLRRPAAARLLPELAVEGTPPEVPGPEQDMGQLRLFDAVYGVLAELAERRTVLLALEDVHWADSSSRTLLSFLLSRMRAHRLLVVPTYRADELHRRHPLRPVLAELVRMSTVDRIELAPFGPQDAQRFVRALADNGIRETDVRQIAGRSEGNAFFAEELLSTCVSCGDVVPAGLADVLLARIERLSPAGQRVVRVASVGGRRVAHAELQAVADLPDLELESALREAVQYNVLLSSLGDKDVYTFRHALVREAVYADLLPGERVRLHAAYARLFAAAPDSRVKWVALARHSLECHDLPQALAASVRAARLACELNAPAEALRHFEQAMRIWDAVPDAEQVAGVDERRLLVKSSVQAAAAGDAEHAIAYARSAVDLPHPATPELAAEAHRRLAQALCMVDGREPEAAEASARAWDLLADRPATHTRAWVLSVRARMLRMAHDQDAARIAATAAIADARAIGSDAAEADALITLAVLDEQDGQADEACARLLEARDRAARAEASNTELRAIYTLGVNRYEHGRVAESRQIFAAGAERAVAVGLAESVFGVALRFMRANTAYVAGDWTAAVTMSPPSVLDLVVRLSVAVARGDWATADSLDAEIERSTDPDQMLPIYRLLARAERACWQRRPADGIADMTAALDALLTPAPVHPASTAMAIRVSALGLAAAADLARTARQRHDAATEQRATSAAERFAAQARCATSDGSPRTGTLGPEGTAWAARADAEYQRVLGTDTPEHWQRVVDAFDYGHSHEQAQARRRLAESLFAAQQRDAAADQLRATHQTATELGAVPLRDELADLAQRSRVPLDGTADRGPVADLLTPREHAVLAEVANGSTNRQVGEALYISEKTVSVHLSRLMAKLGVSSRTEAVSVAYQRGLVARTPRSSG